MAEALWREPNALKCGQHTERAGAQSTETGTVQPKQSVAMLDKATAAVQWRPALDARFLRFLGPCHACVHRGIAAQIVTHALAHTRGLLVVLS